MSGAGQGYGEGFFYTPQDQAAQQQIRRRQDYAKALLQGQGHQGQYGGLADAGSSIAGALLAKRADKDATGLASSAQAKMVEALKGIYQGNNGSGASPQVSNMAGSPQEMAGALKGPVLDPEGNPVAMSEQPRVGPAPQAMSEQGGFADRIARSGNPALMMQFLPQIAQSQMGRENKIWENQQPMSVANQQQIAAQGTQAQQNAQFTNQLPMTAAQIAADRRAAATLGETGRHNRASEANMAQTTEFGKGMQGRAYNILANGIKNPAIRATPEYLTAWQILSNPKVDPNTGTVVVPDLSAFSPPMQAGQPGQSGGGQPQSQQQRMPSIQAFAPPNPSQADALSAGFANRMGESTKQIEENAGALGDVGQHARGGVPLVGNFLTSPQYQKGDQAQRNFINAQLRRESGAAISEGEFENARRQYIPQPGDSKEVLAQKKSNRDMAVRNMQLSAGNTLLPPGVMQMASPPRNAPMVPQQQGFGQMDQAPRVRKYNPQTGQIE